MSYSPYEEHSHASPFLGGKKNSSFVHPNLRSSNVFYDYDYSYKNDLPNSRLLSSVKNDKYSTPSRDERIQNRSTYDTTPEKAERRGTPFYSAQKSSNTESDDGDRQQGNNQSSLVRNQRGSVPNLRLDTPSYRRDNRDQDALSVVSEEPTMKSARNARTNGGAEKFCLHCVNASLADKQKCRTENDRAKDTQHMKEWVAHENKKAAYNYDKERQERVIGKKEKQESKIHAALYDYQRVYGKEEPVIEGGVVMDALFDKYEERLRQNSAREKTLRSYNFEKMVDSEAKKEVDRLDRLTSTHNSLQVGEVHINKYLPPPGTVIRELEQQIESKADRIAREKLVNYIFEF